MCYSHPSHLHHCCHCYNQLTTPRPYCHTNNWLITPTQLLVVLVFHGLLFLSPFLVAIFLHIQFEVETRAELMKRAIKFTQQMIKRDAASGKGLRDGVSPFEEIKHVFERIGVHLQNLSSPELQSETSGIDKVSDCWTSVRAKQ